MYSAPKFLVLQKDGHNWGITKFSGVFHTVSIYRATVSTGVLLIHQ